jgi:L-cysteate sulfo-lyase
MTTDNATQPPLTAKIDLDAIPRISCGAFPTPIEEMKRLRAALGGPNCPRLFIKRDDYSGTAFGGNKLRKLEFAIAAEIVRGTTTIVTIGGEKSNHARVTAAVCAKLGLRCILILNKSDAKQDLIPASRFVYEMVGAEITWVASREEREPKAREAMQKLTDNGENASYLPLGLSPDIELLGFRTILSGTNKVRVREIAA